MPLTSSRGIWICGYFPYNQLPKVKTLIVNCQAVDYPDCIWMLQELLFNSHIVPWQFFISLVLLRQHALRLQEAMDCNADILFFTQASREISRGGSLFEKVLSLKHIQRIIVASILHDVDSHMFSFGRHCRDVVCLSHLPHLDHSKDEAARGEGDGRRPHLDMGAL